MIKTEYFILFLLSMFLSAFGAFMYAKWKVVMGVLGSVVGGICSIYWLFRMFFEMKP